MEIMLYMANIRFADLHAPSYEHINSAIMQILPLQAKLRYGAVGFAVAYRFQVMVMVPGRHIRQLSKDEKIRRVTTESYACHSLDVQLPAKAVC
jgi:hypothetical protein